MAALAIPLAGAGIGYAATVGTAYVAVATQIGWAVGSLVYAYLNREDAAQAPDPGDLGYTGSSYGVNITQGYGTYPAAGVYIWAPDMVVVESEEGGKGDMFGGGVTVNNYYASFAVLFAQGEHSGIRRIWFDTELVYDASENNVGIFKKKGLNIAVYLGTSSQDPDPTIEAEEGAGNVSGHRGYCYIVVDNLALEDYGNRRPSVRAELVKDDTLANPETDLGTTGASPGAYLAPDGTIITTGSSRFYKWNPADNTIFDTSPTFVDWQSEWDIDPDDGVIYGWKFYPSGNYYQPSKIDPNGWVEDQGSFYPICGTDELIFRP